MIFAEHSALLVTDKELTASAYRMYLAKAGVPKMSVAFSLGEAMNLAVRELPHLLILESDLPDASALDVLRKVRADFIFSRLLIVLVRKPTREEILECVKLKVAAIVPKPVDTNALISKLKALVESLKRTSPYAIHGIDLKAGPSSMVHFPGQVLGRHEDHIFCQSQIIAAGAARLSIRPQESALAPLLVAFGGFLENQANPEQPMSLFDINTVMGRGREWALNLAHLAPPKPRRKRVLFLETSRERALQYKDILQFHGIEMNHVDSLQRLVHTYGNDPHAYDCVYICEPPIGVAALPWEKFLKELPEATRPMQIVATSAVNPGPRPLTLWLRKPFGIDAFVQSIEAAFCHKFPVTDFASGLLASSKKIACDFVVSGRLLVLDECGGLLQMPVCPALNVPLNLHHASLESRGNARTVRVVSATQSPVGPDVWLVRFSSLDPGASRGKFWRPIFERLAAEVKQG